MASTFLITGIFGTILAFQLDWAPTFIWPVNLLFWHVEAGIVMTFISLFHLAWHFKYYKAILKNAREKWRVLRATQREFDVADERLVLETREARRDGTRGAARPGAKRRPSGDRHGWRSWRSGGAPVAVRIEKVGPRRPYDLEVGSENSGPPIEPGAA